MEPKTYGGTAEGEETVFSYKHGLAMYVINV